ncbi:hypothetical protein F0U62_01000 [Cystobacter fuscus]|uniref:hypothetical protein n=1 Tax=Cystobacter fuscus TaxID=43 RepID=UPI002B2ADD83|nr:hypothetical protein F0U62_01000 [Cystobacter fuscus]
MAQAFAFQFNLPLPDSDKTLTNVLFINESPAESDTLEVESTPHSGVTMTLMNVSDEEEVSSSSHHFKLTFPSGTLVLPKDILLDASHDGQWEMCCEIEKRVPTSADEYALGDVYLYVLYKGAAPLEVKHSTPLALTLKKVGAVAGTGTRPTLAQLTLHRQETYVTLSGPDNEYNRTENSDLGLINTSMGGASAPSLEAEFSSSNIVLNDGHTDNHLVLRIVNTGLVPILLTPGTGGESVSRFTLRFESSEDISHLWALGKSSEVSSILIPGKPDHTGTDPDWPGHALWHVEGPNQLGEWTLTPKPGNTTLDKGMAIEVPISKVKTGHATGRSALLVRYGGLTGYSDGERVAFIQKQPLRFADQKVGIGTGSPTETLTVETAADAYGITHSDGTVKLSTRLRGTSSTRAAGFGTQTSHDLLFYTNNSVSSPAMTVKTDGRVGIGTSAPNHPLEVRTNSNSSGLSHTDGTHVLATRVGSPGGGIGTLSDHSLNFFTNNKLAQMTLTTGGNVGIGTNAPEHPLQVKTGAGAHGLSHTDGTRTLTTYVNDNGGWFGTKSNHDLQFFANNKTQPQLTLKTSGNVGIGTYTPDYPLQVKTGAGAHGLSHTDGTRTLTTYVSDKGGWFGTKSNHDLHFFTNNHTTTPELTLKTDGKLLLKGEAPFQCKSITVNRGAASGNTGFSKDEWVVFVAGFFLNADDDSADKDISFNCYPKVSGTTWHIFADVERVGDDWRVHVIAIRKTLITGDYSY